MGRKQEVCGAVTGGIMVLGLVHGKGKEDDGKSKRKDLFRSQGLYRCICRSAWVGLLQRSPGWVLLIAKEGRERFIAEKLIEKCQELRENGVRYPGCTNLKISRKGVQCAE